MPLVYYDSRYSDRDKELVAYETRNWPTWPLTNIPARPRHYYAAAFWSLTVGVQAFSGWYWPTPHLWAIFLVCDLIVLAVVAAVQWLISLDSSNT